MKKAYRARARGPSVATLREMPELDVGQYRVRRNPFAARIAREGIQLVHDGPSAASVREIPEVDYSTARIRRNPYASRAAEPTLQYGRGRPKRGDEVGPTPARSLRLPLPMWKRLDAEARARSTTPHALLREIVSRFVAGLKK